MLVPQTDLPRVAPPRAKERAPRPKPARDRALPNLTEIGGPERDQTADLVVANDALYQLSYRPQRELWYWEIAGRK